MPTAFVSKSENEPEDWAYPWPAWDSDEYGERLDWQALGDPKEDEDADE